MHISIIPHSQAFLLDPSLNHIKKTMISGCYACRMNVCRAQVESLEGEIAMTQLTEAAHCQQASDASARSVRCREELLKCVDTMLGGEGRDNLSGN